MPKKRNGCRITTRGVNKRINLIRKYEQERQANILQFKRTEESSRLTALPHELQRKIWRHVFDNCAKEIHFKVALQNGMYYWRFVSDPVRFKYLYNKSHEDPCDWYHFMYDMEIPGRYQAYKLTSDFNSEKFGLFWRAYPSDELLCNALVGRSCSSILSPMAYIRMLQEPGNYTRQNPYKGCMLNTRFSNYFVYFSTRAPTQLEFLDVWDYLCLHDFYRPYMCLFGGAGPYSNLNNEIYNSY